MFTKLICFFGERPQRVSYIMHETNEPKHTNRLSREKSPYLLQHAHNPVDWLPWGTEAWEKSKAENKPVFLSVGYSACHWCHVMERESFENEATAALLNAHFVCVKVDREERPDVDEIYMTAVQMLTGQGGWPMSVFFNTRRFALLRRNLFSARKPERAHRFPVADYATCPSVEKPQSRSFGSRAKYH